MVSIYRYIIKAINMQKKHLIAFTFATIFMLLGFNIINNYFHEKNRAALIEDDTPVATEPASSSNSTNSNGSIDVAAQPLGEQPKAIIDNVTKDIEQAQQVEQQRLEQMDNTQ